MAKPFLKWAGGKTQLINSIKKALPNFLYKESFTYIEPFVGSGAVLFWILNNFPNIEKAVINDINEDLINTYKSIASRPKELISILENLQGEFHEFEENDDEKKEYYYKKRELYNSRKVEIVGQAALFVFLNRTCFNGLYRVNRKNEYNVPIGGYKRPKICDKENILAVSEVLQKVEIMCGDFEQTLNYQSKNSIFYFDPPYKPLSKTSSFNSYSKDDFNDNEQIRLRDFCLKLDILNHSWILNNSDVKGKDGNNNFFDDLYSDFMIQRVDARRSINANPNKRGLLKELLITNEKIKDYLPVIKSNIDLFTQFEKPYWVFEEKVAIDKIKIDKKLMTYDNPIYESTLFDIINCFDNIFWYPITVNMDYYLLDGQHRLEAARRMNLKFIDVVIQNTELL